MRTIRSAHLAVWAPPQSRTLPSHNRIAAEPTPARPLAQGRAIRRARSTQSPRRANDTNDPRTRDRDSQLSPQPPRRTSVCDGCDRRGRGPEMREFQAFLSSGRRVSTPRPSAWEGSGTATRRRSGSASPAGGPWRSAGSAPRGRDPSRASSPGGPSDPEDPGFQDPAVGKHPDHRLVATASRSGKCMHLVECPDDRVAGRAWSHEDRRRAAAYP